MVSRLICIVSDTKLYFLVDDFRPQKGVVLQSIKGCYEVDISLYINSKEQFEKEVWQDLCESAGYISSTYIATLFLYEIESNNSKTIFKFLYDLVKAHNKDVPKETIKNKIEWTNLKLINVFSANRYLDLVSFSFNNKYMLVNNKNYNIVTTDFVKYQFIDEKSFSLRNENKHDVKIDKVIFPKSTVKRKIHKKNKYKQSPKEALSNKTQLNRRDPRIEYLEEKTKNMNFEVSEPR